MSDIAITAGLVVAVGGLLWLVARVVGTLGAGGESASRADRNAVASLPGAERIDALIEEAKRGDHNW